ncbi:MAG: aldolase/citrate lyase family protein, partial [Pseudomonadota bacterium]
MRSWLFVPGDSERKLAKVDGCGADAVILDLEDSVAPQAKGAARERTAQFLEGADRPNLPSLWVRVNPYGSDFHDADVAAVVAARPDGIVLPKSHRAGLAALDERLTALESARGFEPESVRVLAIATETPAAVL